VVWTHVASIAFWGREFQTVAAVDPGAVHESVEIILRCISIWGMNDGDLKAEFYKITPLRSPVISFSGQAVSCVTT